MSKLEVGDTSVVVGVLQTANSIFKRFRTAYMNSQVSDELKYCQDSFTKPMLELFKRATAVLVQVGAGESLRKREGGHAGPSSVYGSPNGSILPPPASICGLP